MGTNLRTNLSKSNPYYISKHRRLELTHFCLQYPEWEEYLKEVNFKGSEDEWSDPTSEEAIKRIIYKGKINLVQECCHAAGDDIYIFLLRSVTLGYPYVQLRTKYQIPCGKDYFYDKLHKFFYILSRKEQMF